MIDRINPVLDFHNNTAVLLDSAWVFRIIKEALGLLEGKRACDSISINDEE